jgi:hypothetical protein
MLGSRTQVFLAAVAVLCLLYILLVNRESTGSVPVPMHASSSQPDFFPQLLFLGDAWKPRTKVTFELPYSTHLFRAYASNYAKPGEDGGYSCALLFVVVLTNAASVLSAYHS